MEEGKEEPNEVLFERFALRKELRDGPDNVVLVAVDEKSGDEVVLKCERRAFVERLAERESPLLHERSVLARLNAPRRGSPWLQGRPAFVRVALGLPRVVFTNTHDGEFTVVGMDRLGPNFEVLRKRCQGGRMSATTLLKLAIQMLNRLEMVHDRGYLHRDVKPDNWVMGRDGSAAESTVHLIDFGTAVRCRLTTAPTYFEVKNDMAGNAVFGSARWHSGDVLTRHDDMESLSYTLIHLHEGGLPWKRCNRTAEVQKLKSEFVGASLRQGEPTLAAFGELLMDSRRGGDGAPRYEWFRQRFKLLLGNHKGKTRLTGRHLDTPFDWQLDD